MLDWGDKNYAFDSSRLDKRKCLDQGDLPPTYLGGNVEQRCIGEDPIKIKLW